MRILKAVLALALGASSICHAQTNYGSSNGTASSTGVVSGSQIATLNGASTYVLGFTLTGAPTSASIQIEGSFNNGASYTLCGSASAVTSGVNTITCAGPYDHVQVDVTTLSGGSAPQYKWSLTALATTVDGNAPVSTIGTTRFYDGFETSFQTTPNPGGRWNTATSAGGGVGEAFVAGGGAITLGTGTTANGYSFVQSQFAFNPVPPGFNVFEDAINVPSALPTNVEAYWGFGTSPTTPTAAIPITEGCGFEIQSPSEKMFAVCFAGSVRTNIQDLSAATGNGTQPTDGATHVYFIYFRGDRYQFAIDRFTNVVAQQFNGANGPNVNTQPLKISAVAGTSNPSSSLTITVASVWVGDISRNGTQIVDGTNPWQAAKVDTNGNLTTIPGTTTPLTGTITTSAGSAVQITYNGMDCVGIVASGVWTGSLAVQQSNDGTTWQPADTLQQLTGKWQESIGSPGRYYSGAFSAQFYRIAGPTATGSATISLWPSPGPCNTYSFAIPGAEAGNGFFGGAVSATVTQTTVADSIQGHDSADIGIVWSGITGSPSGCTLQPQYFFGQSGPAINTGPPLPLTPGTNQVLTAIGPFGLAVQFVYNCTTFPGAGTINVQITYKPGGKTLISGTQPQVQATWTSATALNTTLQQTVSGYGSTNVSISDSAGTFTTGVASFEVSNDATFAAANTFIIQCQRQDGAVASAYSFLSTGLVTFACNVNGWQYFRVRLSTAITGTGSSVLSVFSIVPPAEGVVSIANNPSVFLAGTSPVNVTQINGNASDIDPCQVASIAKTSAPINFSSATTTAIVTNSGSTVIYVCGFSMTMVGATESIKFVYGTHVTTDCDTGQTALTGAFADGTASDIAFSYGPGSTLFKTIASQQLCGVTTGTVSIQGVLTYVQK